MSVSCSCFCSRTGASVPSSKGDGSNCSIASSSSLAAGTFSVSAAGPDTPMSPWRSSKELVSFSSELALAVCTTSTPSSVVTSSSGACGNGLVSRVASTVSSSSDVSGSSFSVFAISAIPSEGATSGSSPPPRAVSKMPSLASSALLSSGITSSHMGSTSCSNSISPADVGASSADEGAGSSARGASFSSSSLLGRCAADASPCSEAAASCPAGAASTEVKTRLCAKPDGSSELVEMRLSSTSFKLSSSLPTELRLSKARV
mmetsp:Transcript_1108/g.3082  ORF Transcript_1108/g.3082 Transcript_1108/m.3082 type:complete len:261 (+) Transcript_1108:2824-3606(+)